SASRTIRSLYSAVNDRRFGRSGEVALSGAPDRAASRTADAVPSRGAAAADFLTDMFSIVTQSQLALDGNYDRVCCLKHVGTEGIEHWGLCPLSRASVCHDRGKCEHDPVIRHWRLQVVRA